jgi:hypothetical protein
MEVRMTGTLCGALGKAQLWDSTAGGAGLRVTPHKAPPGGAEASRPPKLGQERRGDRARRPEESRPLGSLATLGPSSPLGTCEQDEDTRATRRVARCYCRGTQLCGSRPRSAAHFRPSPRLPRPTPRFPGHMPQLPHPLVPLAPPLPQPAQSQRA